MANCGFYRYVVQSIERQFNASDPSVHPVFKNSSIVSWPLEFGVLFIRIFHGRICFFCFIFRTLGLGFLASSNQVRKHEMLSFVLI